MPKERIRTRLKTLSPRVKYHAIFSSPMYRSFRNRPMVLIQPKISSTHFRIRWLIA